MPRLSQEEYNDLISFRRKYHRLLEEKETTVKREFALQQVGNDIVKHLVITPFPEWPELARNCLAELPLELRSVILEKLPSK